jgi:hypothetical protein
MRQIPAFQILPLLVSADHLQRQPKEASMDMTVLLRFRPQIVLLLA